MPDWKSIVRERLASQSEIDEREEVISELAAHLEEAYESARARCKSDAEAVELTLQQVQDWSAVAQEIRRARSKEGFMNYRTKSLWLPTLITLSGASFSLLLIQRMGIEPRLVWIDLRHVSPLSSPLYGKIGMTFYWPWLASLPFFGAAGAYLSRRSQGDNRTRLLAGLSPALIMMIAMCAILPFALAIDGLSFSRLVVFGLSGLANWVALPGVALSIGAMPFLRNQNRSAAIEA
jgi:hypothetical protein